MDALITSLGGLADRGFAAVLSSAGIGVRVTVLLGLTGLALLALRRASAATRHLVAVSGLAGALALPLLASTLPQVDVAVFPARARPHLERPLAGGATAGGAGRLAAARPSASPLPAAARPPAPRDPPPSVLALTLRGLALLAASWSGAAWAAVALAFLARIAGGVHGLALIEQEAEGDPQGSAEATRCRAVLGLRRAVPVLTSPDVTVPLTAGVVRPVVILPGSSTGWSSERRRVVLLHELAHVKRLDWPALMLCEVAAAVWWFHPLAWVVLRAARIEAEKATDALVVRAGERPSTYAGHLVEIARGLGCERTVAGAMPMARPSDLEARLRALLDGRAGGPASARGRALALALPVCAVLIAVVHPTAAAEVAVPVCPARAPVAAAPAVPSPATPRAVPAAAPLAAAVPVTTAVPAPRATAVRAAPLAALALLVTPAGPAAQAAPVLLAGNDERDREHREYRRSRGRLDELLRNPPSSPDRFYELGKQLLRVHDFDGAARAFQEAARRSTHPGSSYYNLACALSLKGSTGEALDALQSAIENGFDDVGLMRTDEDLDRLHGEARFDALVRDAEALELPPVNERASQRGFWRKGSAERESREAADRLEAYLRAHPRSGRAAFGIGIARLNLDEYDASARAFGRALELGYRPATTLYDLACVEARRERLDDAFRYLDRAMEAGFDASGQLRWDDDLDNLRGDPRFRQAIRKADARAGKSGDED